MAGHVLWVMYEKGMCGALGSGVENLIHAGYANVYCARMDIGYRAEY